MTNVHIKCENNRRRNGDYFSVCIYMWDGAGEQRERKGI